MAFRIKRGISYPVNKRGCESLCIISDIVSLGGLLEFALSVVNSNKRASRIEEQGMRLDELVTAKPRARSCHLIRVPAARIALTQHNNMLTQILVQVMSAACDSEDGVLQSVGLGEAFSATCR